MAKSEHLNWLEEYILGLLWDRDLYGLAIKKYLKRYLVEVGTSRLYSTLKSLERKEAVISEERGYTGANKVFYTITEKGKLLFQEQILFPLAIMMDNSSHLKDAIEMIKEMVDIKQGDDIVDISNWKKHLPVFAPFIAPTGKIFTLSKNEIHTALIEDLIEDEDIEEHVSIRIPENKKFGDLPDGIADFVFIFFMLHEDDANWAVDEMKRLMKPGGKGVIVDHWSLDGHFIERLFTEIVPGHSKVGIDKDDIALLENSGLKIIDQRETKEKMVIIVVEHA